MTITYKNNSEIIKINFPMLHKVTYAKTVDNVSAVYQRSYKDHLVDEWLEVNCKHPYYHSPGWRTEKFIEFECDQDAVLFALKWGI